ncbi:MAG: hypothetical protein KatS3mg114_0058 [Planctomycetaceae bacterium]|nr:MAG: hypothetical protein KatS3mg114_0058 [Planctomycetaceae bacterium]
MDQIPDSYLVLGAALFVIGAVGFLTRRNLIVMILCAELMLHAVSINLTAFGRWHGNEAGQAFTIFILTVAACEAALGLALILALYQRRKTLDVLQWHELTEADVPIPSESPATPEVVEPQAWPGLTPAGRLPEWPPPAARVAGERRSPPQHTGTNRPPV